MCLFAAVCTTCSGSLLGRFGCMPFRSVSNKVATLDLDYGGILWFNQLNRYDDLDQLN